MCTRSRGGQDEWTGTRSGLGRGLLLFSGFWVLVVLKPERLGLFSSAVAFRATHMILVKKQYLSPVQRLFHRQIVLLWPW